MDMYFVNDIFERKKIHASLEENLAKNCVRITKPSLFSPNYDSIGSLLVARSTKTTPMGYCFLLPTFCFMYPIGK